MELHFNLQSLNRLVCNHHLLCLRTSTLATYLYTIKSVKGQRQKHMSQTSNPYSTFIWVKCLQYAILGQFTLRTLYTNFLFSNAESGEKVLANSHMLFNPVVVFAIKKFTFLNSTTVACSCMLVFFALYLDYSLSFHLDDYLLQAIEELLVENGHHFRLLNDSQGGRKLPGGVEGGELNRSRKASTNFNFPIWRRLSLYGSLVSKTRNSFDCLKFYKSSLESFPSLSGKLRARMVVLSTIIDSTIVLLNVLSCMCFNFFLISVHFSILML